MHIAMLDESIADRKQMERLLDRESDRRINTTGNLYTDSFGAVDALMIAPKQYDLFMIDLTGSASNCIDLAFKIRNSGIKVPICILRNESEIKDIKDIPDNILYLEKPVKVAELTKLIDDVYALWKEHKNEYIIPEPEEIPVKKNVFRRIFEYFY